MVMGDLPVETQVLVLGAGPGGYAAAFRAADLGLEVTLVTDDPTPGGVCLLRGCIPSKALLSLAELKLASGEAAAMGMRFAEPEVDLGQVRQWRDGVVGKLTDGLVKLCERRGVQLIRGRGRFQGPNHLALEDSDYSSVDFEHAIIATGSRPVSPPGLGVRPEGRIMDSTGALALGDVPERLLVVGGGYVGLEMGTVYAVLGSRVTLVEMADRLLPGADTDLVRPLRRRLDELFDAIRLETRVTRAQEDDRGVAVTLEGGNGEERFDRVLVAVGRRPNTDDIGLTEAGVALDDQGLISVDEQRRTSQERIFAIGDAVGGVQLAHKAMHEGKVAAEAIAGRPAAFDPRAISAVVYTDPQVAWCGLTEDDARSQGREVTVTRFPWRASGRALTTGSEDGLTKLIMDPETGRLLGAGMVGRGAEGLIAEAVLAVEMGALAEDLAFTIHPHPTLSETVGEAAELFGGSSTHLGRHKGAGG
jgi:dihydrolipoamide dehydrogenase